MWLILDAMKCSHNDLTTLLVIFAISLLTWKYIKSLKWTTTQELDNILWMVFIKAGAFVFNMHYSEKNSKTKHIHLKEEAKNKCETYLCLQKYLHSLSLHKNLMFSDDI